MARSRYRRKNSVDLKIPLNITKIFIITILLSGFTNYLLREKKSEIKKVSNQFITNIYGSPPLIMEGGNPYIRALMRTISSSEANYIHPYNVIYSGKHIEDLSRHPNRCVTIRSGPNRGKCSTASGRYQFLNSTWEEKAAAYHPQPKLFLGPRHYSFEAKYQDQVLYSWLTDPRAWEEDIAQLLEEGKIEEVLRLLSPTWTSLGYGIEDNSMTDYLPSIYNKLLQEELALSNNNNSESSSL